MAQAKTSFLAFNRGLVSPLALARMDVKRLALSAEEMTNWIPRVLGSMMLRPGTGYLGSTRSDAAARFLPFVFSTSDKALIELTDSAMRVWVDDQAITRSAVSTAVVNGTFDSNLSSWTNADESGATSSWQAGGYMGLVGNGTAFAIRRQQVTVAAADKNVEHALHIIINRGPVILRVGSTSGGDEYISETGLGVGAHSLAFTPTGDFYVEFKSSAKRLMLVDSCVVESAGDMVVETPWVAVSLASIRYDQSADVVFVACEDYQQRRIERRGTRSWSVVRYQAMDGPFRTENVSTVTLTPSALSGNITVAASAPVFRASHALSATNDGAIFSITSNGQNVSATITAGDQFTSAIRVTGVDASRVFTLSVDEDAVGAATFTLQRSLVSDAGPWSDVLSRTADTTETYDDTLDNQIAWYRIGVKTGDYVSGTHTVQLAYTVGAITGVIRITTYTSPTAVGAEVITDLGGLTASDVWAEGSWSEYRGFPTAVAFHEGRLAWAGQNGVWLSVSDAFDSFDAEVEGDSAPIARTIGSGPVDRINWMLSLQRLILGAEGAEFSCRSSSLDEPLTPTNFNIKDASTQGSSAVSAIKVDKAGIYVQRGGTRMFNIAMGDDYEYGSTQLSAIVPEIGQPRITRIAMQRQPDTRVHFVRSDGTVALLVFDKIENVTCWLEIETASGDAIEDVVVLPGDSGQVEDQVYYVVRRTVSGSTKRYLERWALEADCQGGTLNRQMDAFTRYTGASSTTITGLSHLEGRTVAVWGGGAYLGTHTVSGGQVTGLSTAVTSAISGLPYTARWKSAKVAFATALGIPLNAHKILQGLGLVLYNTHATGLRYGPSFDTLQDLPGIENGKTVGANDIRAAYDEEPFTFPGEWSSDSRLCLQATAPKPCTILAATVDGEVH